MEPRDGRIVRRLGGKEARPHLRQSGIDGPPRAAEVSVVGVPQSRPRDPNGQLRLWWLTCDLD